MFGIRLVHHRHSGRKLGRQHTSYVLLFFILSLTGSALFLASHYAKAAQQEASISINGNMPSNPPNVAAEILNPQDNSRFSESIIKVDGICQAGMLVELYRKGIFAGSVFCDNSGRFDLNLKLINGQNDIQAKTKDAEGRYGPDSRLVRIFYDMPINVQNPNNSSMQPSPIYELPLLIYTEPVQRSADISQKFVLKFELDGGTGPYAVVVDWGDGNQEIYSYPSSGDFTESHKYANPGQYTVTIRSSDKNGIKGFIQLIAVVQGVFDNNASIAQDSCSYGSNTNYCHYGQGSFISLINRFWPAFILACLLTVSFWLGEKVMARKFTQRPKHI